MTSNKGLYLSMEIHDSSVQEIFKLDVRHNLGCAGKQLPEHVSGYATDTTFNEIIVDDFVAAENGMKETHPVGGDLQLAVSKARDAPVCMSSSFFIPRLQFSLPGILAIQRLSSR